MVTAGDVVTQHGDPEQGLVGHDPPSPLALARSRTRAYRPRDTGGVDGHYIVGRILALIAAQPLTPSLRQIYYLLSNEGTIPKGKYTVVGRGGKLVERDSAK